MAFCYCFCSNTRLKMYFWYFTNNKTRNGDKTWNKDDIAEYNRIKSHAQRIVDILTHED